MAEYRTLAEAIRRDLGPGLMPDPRNVDIIEALIAAHFEARDAAARRPRGGCGGWWRPRASADAGD